MKTRLSSFAALALLLPALLPAQVTFMRTYGGAVDDMAYSVQQTMDGGYLMAGYTDSFGAGRGDVWLIKTDALGDTAWTRTIGGEGLDQGRSAQQTHDGGCIVVGSTSSAGAGGTDAWLIRTDSLGDTLWTETLGGAGEDYAHSVWETRDGGYVLGGYTSSYGAGDDDLWLLKTDASGNTLWAIALGGEMEDRAYSVQQTADGGYAVAGWTKSFGAGTRDAWLIKTDSLGDTAWAEALGGEMDDRAYSVRQTTDGGFILVGRTNSPGGGARDAWLVKTDCTGDTVWTRTFGGEAYDDGHSVQQTGDGGYVLAGQTFSYGAGGGDAWLIKTDSLGDSVWARTFGGAGYEDARSVRQTADGGYIVAGYTESFGAGEADVWLIKTDSLGNVGVEEGRQTLEARRWTLDIRPNPCAGLATVSLKPQAPSSKPQTLRVYDASGSLVLSRAYGVERQASSVVLDLGSMPSGVYTLRLGSATTRLVVQH